MDKYKITFNFDIDDLIVYDDEYTVDVLEVDDSNFIELFKSENKITEFENWFNDGEKDEYKINVNSIMYEPIEEYSGEIIIELDINKVNETDLMINLLDYMFEEDYPILYTHEYGYAYEPYWTGTDVGEKRVKFDYDEKYAIRGYNNEKIEKI